MAVPRVISQGRCLISRAFTAQRAAGPVFRAISTSSPARQFSSSACVSDETSQKPHKYAESISTLADRWDESPPPGTNAKSIAIFKLPIKTTPADVEAILRNAGVDIQRMMFRIDRFTFGNDSNAFVELASEEQAKKAVEALNGQQMQKRTLKVLPMSSTFTWDSGFKEENRMFFYDKDTAVRAVQSIIDGRRCTLYVENPGWKAEKGERFSTQGKRREVVKRTLEPFGLEAIGGITTIWNHDKRKSMSVLTSIDFESKEGAERAMKALDNQVVEGKRVQLKPYVLSQVRAEQISRVDKSVLAHLQQNGVRVVDTKHSNETAKETEA